MRLSILLIIAFTTTSIMNFSKIQAHGEETVIERESAIYRTILGYDETELKNGDPTPLTFTLIEKASNSEVEFSDVWLQVTRKGETIFAGGIKKANLGKTSVIFPFSEPGEYVVVTRFNQAGKTVSEEVFVLNATRVEPIQKAESDQEENKSSSGVSGKTNLFISGLVGAVAGAVVVLVLKFNRSN